MASDVQGFSLIQESYRQHQPSQKPHAWLKLFLPNKLLKFVLMNISSSLTVEKKESYSIKLMAYWYRKLTKTTSEPKTVASLVTTIVLENGLIAYGIPDTALIYMV